ncbi:MAG: CoA transferase [Gammaproteobacteria bacterium]|jgi:crotonobetainyl-CoA:carnitine CoA-transferase CaiB-like acyl-CoA transferase|nr:CoA transferase [Gammaproteobacteria bacterium]MBT5216637.1 CoA transferase [Gammaproteobacteria bacterium]MBT5542381.1 CoA transferase [Gammaproteobacteria bacterium]MBT6073475.1 CoA transferase [Gammaproteobacteria bacterium]MBT7753923.1 CoA transferase [Gammaproteobacteria bacterium]
MELPLSGIKVIEMTHMVMGPAVGAILGDLGAEVIKIEPIGGDKTRNLKQSGSGYFLTYNRNKKSIALDIKTPEGKEIVTKLLSNADVFIENFRPGAMDKLGLGYDDLEKLNPRIIYCSAKGFLKGPYEHRTALDEVAQMMGGLAYMTGPPGRPLRAGSSVIDIMGGMFGAIGIMAALEERHRTDKGQKVTSALYENVVYLMGQHMAQTATTGSAPPPMSVRVSAWAVYDIFETKDEEKVFVGVVSDGQWKLFCESFEINEFIEDKEMDLNAGRVEKRDIIIPHIQALFKNYNKADLMEKLDQTGLPFAPISKPEDLFNDEHLNASNGLIDIKVPYKEMTTKLPSLPIEMKDQRFDLHHPVPEIGEHSKEILREIGCDEKTIEALFSKQIVS